MNTPTRVWGGGEMEPGQKWGQIDMFLRRPVCTHTHMYVQTFWNYADMFAHVYIIFARKNAFPDSFFLAFPPPFFRGKRVSFSLNCCLIFPHTYKNDMSYKSCRRIHLEMKQLEIIFARASQKWKPFAGI